MGSGAIGAGAQLAAAAYSDGGGAAPDHHSTFSFPSDSRRSARFRRSFSSDRRGSRPARRPVPEASRRRRKRRAHHPPVRRARNRSGSLRSAFPARTTSGRRRRRRASPVSPAPERRTTPRTTHRGSRPRLGRRVTRGAWLRRLDRRRARPPAPPGRGAAAAAAAPEALPAPRPRPRGRWRCPPSSSLCVSSLSSLSATTKSWISPTTRTAFGPTRMVSPGSGASIPAGSTADATSACFPGRAVAVQEHRASLRGLHERAAHLVPLRFVRARLAAHVETPHRPRADGRRAAIPTASPSRLFLDARLSHLFLARARPPGVARRDCVAHGGDQRVRGTLRRRRGVRHARAHARVERVHLPVRLERARGVRERASRGAEHDAAAPRAPRLRATRASPDSMPRASSLARDRPARNALVRIRGGRSRTRECGRPRATLFTTPSNTRVALFVSFRVRSEQRAAVLVVRLVSSTACRSACR